MKLNYSTISFEGERGTGKSTAISSLIQYLRDSGFNTILNRELNTADVKGTSENHVFSIQLYEKWLSLFEDTPTGTPRCLDKEQAESLAFMRFHNVVVQLLKEKPLISEAFLKNDVLICDRDLDSVVAYGAVEIILSNTEKYQTEEDVSALLNSLWSMVLSIRNLPEVTFYLTSNALGETLHRSYLSKLQTPVEYQLTQMQQAMQEKAQRVFSFVLLARQRIFPESKIIKLNVDGKRPDEVFQSIRNELTTRIISAAEDVSKNLLHLRTRGEDEHPKNLEELITLIFDSSIGAAFPSYAEVTQLGFSNCVYNNAALAYFARIWGLANIKFVSIEKDDIAEASPVHWVVIEFIDETTARIIDLSPFNKKPLIGEVTPFRLGNKGEIFLDCIESESSYLAREVHIEDPQFAFELMQYAYDTQNSDALDSLAVRGADLLDRSHNESQEIFAAVRYIRILEKQKNLAKILMVLEYLTSKYKNNLILAREIARLALQEFDMGKYKLYILSCIEVLKLVTARKFKQANKILQSGDIEKYKYVINDIESYINYYDWLLETVNVSREELFTLSN